ncbi:hypothetical protein M1M96_02095 [Peptococcaceae bacterium]|nr:hypothetical protein [Peptococcaceae bacterium]
MLETLESSRYARTIANYVYQKRPHACLQQEFEMEEDPIIAAIYEGLKGAAIGETVALFLEARGDSIDKKDVLAIVGVGAAAGVLLYGVGRLLR